MAKSEGPDQRGPRHDHGSGASAAGYFSDVEMWEKTFPIAVPRLLTATRIAIAMPEAINAYSTAVAAVSSARKCLKIRRTGNS